MTIFVDTSVLGRIANQSDADHLTARTAVATLHRRGERLVITGQNLVEFRNFATRPTTANGLGMAPPAAAALAATLEASFPLLDETPAVYPTWRTIADALGVVGKQVYDARLVAVCHVYGVAHVLTFNVAHFTRFAGYGPGITVLDTRHV